MSETRTAYNYKRDAKTNRAGDAYAPRSYDACQTPPEALEPLLPYIPTNYKTVWEPAAGEGLLAAGLRSRFAVIASDILTGRNFFDWQPPGPWDMIITNPPFSIKYDWLLRAYNLGRPFALLMPVEMMAAKSAQVPFERFGVEIILMRRVNFKMPNKGFSGAGAQFPVAWYTWGLGIGRQLTFSWAREGGDDGQ